jgi:hypothetical protein
VTLNAKKGDDSSSLAYVRVGADGPAGVHALGKQAAGVAGNATCSSHGSSIAELIHAGCSVLVHAPGKQYMMTATACSNRHYHLWQQMCDITCVQKHMMTAAA